VSLPEKQHVESITKQKWKQTSGRRRPRAHREKTVTTDDSK